MQLFIREANGRYRVANADQVIESANEQIREKFTRSGDFFTDPTHARNTFKYRLAMKDREVFSVAFLTTKNELIEIRDLFYGTIDGAEVYPREIAKAALELNASAIILAHNHPSGSAQASAADIACTRRIKQAMELIDVRVLDHIIVAGNLTVSMASEGLM